MNKDSEAVGFNLDDYPAVVIPDHGEWYQGYQLEQAFKAGAQQDGVAELLEITGCHELAMTTDGRWQATVTSDDEADEWFHGYGDTHLEALEALLQQLEGE